MPAFKLGPTPPRHSVWPLVLGAVLILGVGMWALETGRAWVNLTLAGVIVLWRVVQARRTRARAAAEEQAAADPSAGAQGGSNPVRSKSVQSGDLDVDEHPRRAGAGEDA